MTDPGPARTAGDKPPTKWGDREQRRIDILEAARALIEGDGYVSLSMRTLAADAGVSPATLYSYFATKEELFATLYGQAIRSYTADFERIVEDAPDLRVLLERLVELYVELYRRYGRHYGTWSLARHEPGAEVAISREVLVELRDAAVAHSRVQMPAVIAAAARSGRALRDPVVAPSLLWSFLTGIADHVTSERGDIDPYSQERFLAGAVDGIVEGLTSRI